VLTGGEEKRAELPSGSIHRGEVILLQESGEERLRQIFRLVLIVPAAADVGVNRIPVLTAQVGERLPGIRGSRIPRRRNQAPLSGAEHEVIVPHPIICGAGTINLRSVRFTANFALTLCLDRCVVHPPAVEATSRPFLIMEPT
jgi:hypothetical protein